MSPASPPPPSDPPLRRNADFVRLWTGGAASALGSAIAGLAYPLLALSVTGSASLAGLVGLVGLGTASLLRLPAGALVDRTPLRRLLVLTDLVRAGTTALIVVAVLTDRLTLVQLLATAMVNAGCAVGSETAHSVALRHVVPPARLPEAFAANDGRGHAVSLLGQPAGGFLYSLATAVPFLADAVSYLTSALLSAAISTPLRPSRRLAPDEGTIRRDLLTGLRFVRSEPFLRASLAAAAGMQFVFAGASFALIAGLTARGATPGSLGMMFAVAAVGGILGAVAAPRWQTRARPQTLVVTMGWVATVTFLGCGWIDRPLVAGMLLGLIYLTAAPANAMLAAAQIHRTPPELQGRVIAAAFLIAGLVVPLGPLTGGLLLDHLGRPATFVTLAALTALLTVAVHLNRAMRELDRPR